MDKNYLALANISKETKITKDKVKYYLSQMNDYDVNYAVSFKQSVSDLNKFSGNTLLHFIILNSNDNLALLLEDVLNRKANFNQKNDHGFTPLRLGFEVGKNNKTLIDLLLSAHVKFNDPTNPSFPEGITHMHIACLKDNPEVVKFFLNSGVSIDLAIDTSSRKYPGFTCLHLAMKNEDYKMADFLLSNGANYDCLNADGLSFVHMLVAKHIDEISSFGHDESKKIKEKIHELIDTILKKNEIGKIDGIGLTQFHLYCMKDSFNGKECNKILKEVMINAQINMDSPIYPGYTLLHFAVVCCKVSTITYLLKKGADLLIQDAKGETPLDLCLKKYNPCKISKFLKTCPDLEKIKLENGDNLYDVVYAFQDCNKLINYLEKVNVNDKIPYDSPLWPGFTLLHLAVLFSPGTDRKRVQIVCGKADITIKAANGMTAIHLAFRLERKRCIIDIFEKHYYKAANSTDNNNLSHFLIACSAYNYYNKLWTETFLKNGEDPNVFTQKDKTLRCIVFLRDDLVYGIIPPGSTPLHIAIATGYQELTNLLLSYGANPNLLDAEGFTWVHRALTSPKFNHFKTDLWKKIDLKTNPVAPGGLSHLHVACYSSDSQIVQELLNLQININEPINSDLFKYLKDLPIDVTEGDTPLHLAIKGVRPSMELIEMLLNKGADASAVNKKGLSSFHEALNKIERLSPKIIELLSSACKNNGNTMDFTPLHLACALKNESLIEKLIKKNEKEVLNRIDQNSPIWPNYTPLCVLMRNEFILSSIENSIILLLDCILKNFKKSSTYRALHGLRKRRKTNDESLVFRDDLSAFHICCMGKDPKIVEKYIKSGIFNIDEPKNHFAITDAGFTPLHFAVKYGSDSVIEVLLKHGANFHLENSQGFTPLHLAAATSSSKIKLFLRQTKVNFAVKNYCGQSVIDVLLRNYAVSSDFYKDLLKQQIQNIDKSTKTHLVMNFMSKFCDKTFNELLDLIPQVEHSRDSNGDSILHSFISTYIVDRFHNIKSDNIKLLIKRGCEFDSQNNSGKTPLHLAVISNSFNLVKLLINMGSDINIRDDENKTPFMYCFNNANTSEVDDFLFLHVKKILHAGLHVNQINENFFKSQDIDYRSRNEFLLSSFYTKDIKSSELQSFLSEKNLKNFRHLSISKRQSIIENLDSEILHEQYENHVFLFKLQKKKLFQRKSLFETVIDSLQFLIKLPVPCLEVISENLGNDDWINLIRVVEALKK